MAASMVAAADSIWASIPGRSFRSVNDGVDSLLYAGEDAVFGSGLGFALTL